MNFNKLTPAETERLAILMEEASEVIHICGKILRHGYNSFDPTKDNPPNNRHLLHVEIAHFSVAVQRMIEAEDLDSRIIDIAYDKKSESNNYLHHQ